MERSISKCDQTSKELIQIVKHQGIKSKLVKLRAHTVHFSLKKIGNSKAMEQRTKED